MTVLDEDVDFLAHFGVKGQKWGVRRSEKKTAKIQNRIDRVTRVRDGNASAKDRVIAGYVQGTYTKKQAARGLRRGAALQKKVADGDAAVTSVLLKMSGIRILDLDYNQPDA